MVRNLVISVIIAAVGLTSCAAVPETVEEPMPLGGSYEGYSTSADELQLTVFAIVGTESCYAGHDLRVSESDEAVTVELVAHRKTGVRWCEAAGILWDETAALDRPLGSRPVVDATSDRVLEAGDGWGN
ncbi:MAG: hypothetical protein AAF548_00085 [Actinomycetota bacterium]